MFPTIAILVALRYCTDMPPFQEGTHIRGHNGDNSEKISWMLQLRKAGYTFSQVGGVFVVQFPRIHDRKSPSSKAITAKAMDDSTSSLNDFRKWLEEEYDPNDTKTGRCTPLGK